jgi:hypothetical protein
MVCSIVRVLTARIDKSSSTKSITVSDADTQETNILKGVAVAKSPFGQAAVAPPKDP